MGLYTWDARTGYPTKVAESTGLELVGYVLAPAVWVKEQGAELWNSYVALIGVAEENQRLKTELDKAHAQLEKNSESLRELERLRKLFSIPPSEEWKPVAARVISGRFGPHAMLETMILNQGLGGGASPGVPVVSRQGLLGRVYRSAPHSSTVLLVTDASFRVSVIGQESRARGIFAGAGVNARPEVHYVGQNAQLKEGELLISSGLDGYVPKGIPVARVESVRPGHETLFQQVQAVPVASVENAEEVLLLMPTSPSTKSALADFTRLPAPEKPEDAADNANKPSGRRARTEAPAQGAR